ncbi:Putative ribosomal N-acetyltransferase YdaF [Streptomyces avidinii]
MFSIDLAEGAQLFPLEIRHAEELLAHMERGREHIGQYVGLPDVVADLDGARSYLATYAQKAATDTGRLYGIRVDGVLVGGVLFRTFDADGGTCEAGCWLEPSMTGRGLVTKACRTIIDWAFRERGMHRVEWHVDSANKKSIAAAERLGMTREGVMRENHFYRGRRRDTEIWSVLAHEWQAAPPA